SGFLDMRLSPEEPLTAYEVVNRRSERELTSHLREFGEERHAALIAHAIVTAREKHSIDRADELARIIEEAVPPRYARMKIHPATRTFQALRIVVNDELGALSEGLRGAWAILSKGGAISVISFHSLEDRIVKRFMKDMCALGEGRLVMKKPVRPTREEIDINPKSRSARLRAIKKI
ncbi:MAG: 16S rRNA (cytosine(1402)-N(4))-methyltransferase RsmH, partial [bacterium]|nr:16S rRNA (cytosine(1402)-N(4))-methyltransferase RsmH [bacterium]